MKGTVTLRTDVKMPYWIVNWPMNGKVYKISRYLGEKEPMYQTHQNKKKDIGYMKANKLLPLIQADWERHCRGELTFRIEYFTGELLTDVIPYMQEWLDAREPTLTPGGFAKYKRDVNNYLTPFFTMHPVMLHEIRYDTLVKLVNFIEGSGKHKKNVVDTLRCCMRFAHKSERIPNLPPFPEKKLYDIKKVPPHWLPRNRFENVMKHIPDEHKPFYMWLYLHLRRPGEAMALHKEDYDAEQDIFTIQRGVSNNKVINRTKTGDIHEIPCVSEFKQYMASMPKSFGPYFFTCRESKSEGNRYTGKLYRKYWNEACIKAGEKIDTYRGRDC
ncbi:MAG: site-specific integrase [Methanosarcinaceae archaeon]|nr:site-specific integrase [Methanosarcinaceae archaeon]